MLKLSLPFTTLWQCRLCISLKFSIACYCCSQWCCLFFLSLCSLQFQLTLVSIIVTLKVLPRSGIHMKKACKPINHQPAICHLNHGQLPWIADSKITLLIIHQILFLWHMQLVLMHHMTIDSTTTTREQIQGETLSDFAQFSDPMST